MQKLLKGIHKFQSNIFGARREQFEKLVDGQHPEVMFISCSDSRLDPSLVTQTAPGDMFVLRNAGNIVPPHGAGYGGEEATIEFAVAGLGVRDIVLCGHSHCGAIKGLLQPDALKGLPAMSSWLAHAESTRRIVGEKYSERQGDALLTTAVEENVLVQLENLRTHPAVAAGLRTGKIKLHAWVYKFETGQVFSYEPSSSQFTLLRAPSPVS
jgi:carbonic anhydrase